MTDWLRGANVRMGKGELCPFVLNLTTGHRRTALDLDSDLEVQTGRKKTRGARENQNFPATKGGMLTDEDMEKIAMLLESYGLTKKPSAGALRTQRYRERQKDRVTNGAQNVTTQGRKRHKTSRTVTKRHKEEAPSSATWAAYSEAYQRRYGVGPMRNAMVNGQLANFVSRIPAAEAPLVAGFYVQSNRGLYVSAKHAVNLLVRDAEMLRTEWATGQSGTDTQARQADRTAATGNVFSKLIGEVDASH